MLGFIIAAVSPAVIVPQMIELQESNRGDEKRHSDDGPFGCLVG